MKTVNRSGRPRGADDLLIAATALARSRLVVTADRGGFADLPWVGVRSVEISTAGA
jgi:tRNA(fMet)-specific endonuclease VapC